MFLRYGTFVLADSDRGDAVVMNKDASRVVDEVTYPGSTGSTAFPRGNHRSNYSFTVTRIFRSMDEAHLEAVDQDIDLPDQALLSWALRAEGAGGVTRYLPKACLTRQPAKVNGVRVVFSYEFTGGKPTRKPPKSTEL